MISDDEDDDDNHHVNDHDNDNDNDDNENDENNDNNYDNNYDHNDNDNDNDNDEDDEETRSAGRESVVAASTMSSLEPIVIFDDEEEATSSIPECEPLSSVQFIHLITEPNMSAAVLNRCMRHIVDHMTKGGAHVFDANLMHRLERTAVYGGGFEDPDVDRVVLKKPTLLFPVRAPEPDSNRWCLVYVHMTKRLIEYYDCGQSQSKARYQRRGNDINDYISGYFSCMHLIVSYLSSRRQDRRILSAGRKQWNLSVPTCHQELHDELSGGFVCRTAAGLVEKDLNEGRSTVTNEAIRVGINDLA